MRYSDGATVRRAVIEGRWQSPTRGLARGFVQTGLVAVPERYAADFLLFCSRNPKPCPVIEVVEKGGISKYAAPGAALWNALPGYRVYQKGHLIYEGPRIDDYWRNDLVCFLLGCSYSFEYLLEEGGLRLKGNREGRGNPIYVTNRECIPAGVFRGPLVVSMRPVAADKVSEAVLLSARLPLAHGAPVHIGCPEELGVDLEKPDFGNRVSIEKNEVPVFWACSITPQEVALRSGLDLMITQSPGHMLVTDLKVMELLT
ncbi:MAG TPA: DUF1445 domain-containing protein [Firmicutes bacterium]|nr:DUF1445 domain-containing protein [Bacillota bacterium]